MQNFGTKDELERKRSDRRKNINTHGEWREPRLWSVHPVVPEPRK